MARLIVEKGHDAGFVYPLGTGAVTIGRSASCEVQVIDKRVSRHHAVIQPQRHGYVIEDLGSKNGTLVNNKPLVGRIQLHNGDRIQVGDCVLVFELDADEGERPDPQAPKTGGVSLDPNGELQSAGRVVIESSSRHQAYQPESFSREQLKDPFVRLRVLYRVTDSIRSIWDLKELLHKLMDILWEVITPHRGIVLLRDPEDGTLDPVVVRVHEGASDEIHISRGIVERCMAEQVAILVSDAPSDVRFSANESVIRGRIRSAICVPLVSKSGVEGVIYIDSQVPGEVYYTQEDLELMKGIAAQAALAIENARLTTQLIERQKLEKELELARSIQIALLPKKLPEAPGVSFSAMSVPARKVGGDYYDFFELSDGRIALVVADVSGKGMPAAILTATIRASLRMETHVHPDLPLSQLMAAVNAWTCKDVSNNMFVTLFFGIFDPQRRTLEYSNAGHLPPLLFKPDGSYRQLTAGGCFLGIMEFLDYETEILEIQDGDTLVVLTDGVTDTHNSQKQVFGMERVIATVRDNLHLPPEELRDELYEATLLFRGPEEQFDDVTILVARF
ncbi:MAG: SpoIIE family protein phosphatase [Candidatus Sumerlaeaceae bacterium]|nr:SpoIIE family protein phosphatase [Candidatus Sumerlaeaceae bacterium]